MQRNLRIFKIAYNLWLLAKHLSIGSENRNCCYYCFHKGGPLNFFTIPDIYDFKISLNARDDAINHARGGVLD